MKDLISLDQVLQNIKVQNEESRLTIEAAEKTIEIINKIVETREALGLTQRDLAKKCGIQQPALARIETFKVVPQINTLIKIAKAAGVSIEAFTDIESMEMQVCFSISRIVINSSCYNNDKGGYSWRQNSIILH